MPFYMTVETEETTDNGLHQTGTYSIEREWDEQTDPRRRGTFYRGNDISSGSRNLFDALSLIEQRMADMDQQYLILMPEDGGTINME